MCIAHMKACVPHQKKAMKTRNFKCSQSVQKFACVQVFFVHSQLQQQHIATHTLKHSMCNLIHMSIRLVQECTQQLILNFRFNKLLLNSLMAHFSAYTWDSNVCVWRLVWALRSVMVADSLSFSFESLRGGALSRVWERPFLWNSTGSTKA